MIRTSIRRKIFALGIMIAACSQAGAGPRDVPGWAAGLDPTGVAQMASDLARNGQPQPEEDEGEESAEVNFGGFAPSLKDIAAGRTERPNIMASVESQADEIMALQVMSFGSSVANAAIGAALSGGASLASSAPQLAVQAASAGMAVTQMTAVKGQLRAAIAQAEAQRAAERIVPDEDRPLEAQAILSVLEGRGRGSATWQNPATGASGKVTVQALNRKVPSSMDCRLVKQQWTDGKRKRAGSMSVCRSGGEWYDLS
jgi:hypothetical protein